MQLKEHVRETIAADPRLQRLLGRELSPELDWAQVVDDAGSGALSAGEAALVRCLAALAGAAIEDFDKHFDRLDGQDQAVIRGIITAATATTLQAETHAHDMLQRGQQQ